VRRASFVWYVAAGVLALAECLVMARLWPWAARPSLTFVLAAAAAIRGADRRLADDRPLLWLCFGIGLIRDCFTLGPLGGNAFIYVTSAAALIGVRRIFCDWSPMVWAAAGFGLFFAGHLLEGAAVSLAGAPLSWRGVVGISLAAAAAETALLPAALLGFRKLRVSLRGT
jgi:rod shape-determining protein MreD